ncbi:hypothetical protein Tco_1248039 [Tanacetum coccineum]
MSTVMSHMNMEVDTISDIDIRNNSLNKNLRSATASHHHNSEIQRRGITRKNQGQDGDAKATLFNFEPTAETSIFNKCLVEEESEVEGPVCKSIVIKKEDQDLHFMSCARKCNGQCPAFRTSECKSNFNIIHALNYQWLVGLFWVMDLVDGGSNGSWVKQVIV